MYDRRAHKITYVQQNEGASGLGHDERYICTIKYGRKVRVRRWGERQEGV